MPLYRIRANIFARAPQKLATVGIVLLLSACASSGASGVSSYDRGRLAAELRCPPPELLVREHGWRLGTETWGVDCRGLHYGCTRAATIYNPGINCVESREPAATKEPTERRASQEPPPSPPATETPSANEMRAALDREREGILACADRRVVGMKAQTRNDHSLDIHLTGDLSGSLQEACVLRLLAELRINTASPGTSIVHVVRK